MEHHYCIFVIFSVLIHRFSAQTTVTSNAPNTAQSTGILDMGTVSIPTGTVTSPGYPHKYPPNVDRTVSIALPLHSTVEVYFDGLDTPDCFDCNCDFVEMSFFSRFCGSKIPSRLMTTSTRSRYFEIRFRSDDKDERTGFSLRYIIYPTTTTIPTTIPTTPPCPFVPCHSSCPPWGQTYMTDYRGCSFCHCEMPSSPASAQTTTMVPVVGNSLLLHILLNLRTQAEAMERQAKSFQETAEVAMALAHVD